MGGAPRGMDILNGVVSAVSELVIPPKSFCFNILGMRRRSSIVGQSL
jgi:type IV secretory pathway TrbD component